MTERPIPMSAPMVRAILSGSKSQTRRVVKPQPTHFNPAGTPRRVVPEGGPSDVIRCPYGQPGDRLWVRESFSGPHHQEKHPPRDWHSSDEIHYWADGCPNCGDWTRPRPGMFMPRWASRITLEVTGVRVERLQDISEADAVAEGVAAQPCDHVRRSCEEIGCCGPTARGAYRALWEQINGPGSWDANPWVWCVEFKRMAELNAAQDAALRERAQ